MKTTTLWLGVALIASPSIPALAASSRGYAPVVIEEDFEAVKARMEKAKADVLKKHSDLLSQRYDLADRAAEAVTMSRGKPVQSGVSVKLAKGASSWSSLAAMAPSEVRAKKLFPTGLLPLPHPNHPEGGMLFPQFHIDQVNRQEKRDLTRFDLEFDLPINSSPNFRRRSTHGPTLAMQIEGLRLLLTPFPQQQFNRTEDRRSAEPSKWGCMFRLPRKRPHERRHASRRRRPPQEFRHRIDTPSLRGVNTQRLFGSQRALKTVVDFTEFEQRAAYFDGDPVIATKKA